MTNESFSSVAELISQALGISSNIVTREFSYGDVPEWDSMGHMNIMMALEEKFGVVITAETITNLISVPAIIKYLVDQKNG